MCPAHFPACPLAMVIDAYLRMAITKQFGIYRSSFRRGNGFFTHFLMKHLDEAGPEKKDPLRGSFFSYRPSAGAAPRSVPTQQTVYVIAPT